MTEKPVRVGIIGAGGIARGYHLRSYRHCAGVEVVAACDVNEAALESLQSEYGIQRVYTHYAEMLANEPLDLVSICTSNDMHYPAAMAAMAHGADVYCEKPLAITVSQAQRMVVAAEEQGIKTGVNFSHRRTPAAMLAKEILDSGTLGEIYYASAVYAAGGVNYATRPGTWRNDREKAGYGGLGDMGSHIIDMMMWLLQADITEVACRTRTFVPQRIARDTGLPMRVTTEDQGMLLLSYANGAMGYLCGSYTFTGRGYDQRIEIYGQHGGLMYNQQRPYELQVHLPPEALARYLVTRKGGTTDTPYATILTPERLHGLIPGTETRRTVLMDFIDAYRAEGPFSFSPGFREGLRVQEVLEAGRRAEETHRWVSL